MDRKSRSSLREFYNDRYTSKAQGRLFRSRVFIQAEHQRIESTILQPFLHHIRPDSTVLDLGAGRSAYLSSLKQVVAIDISHVALSEVGRSRRVCAELDLLPLRDSIADVVICSQTLEHVQEAEHALSEIARVTRNGGLLCLTVPNRYALMHQRYHALERDIDRSGHLHEFREGWLHMQLIRNGFEILLSQGACYDLFWLLSSAERGRHAARLVRVLDKWGDPRLLARLLEFDGRLRRHSLRGLSLEIVAKRC